MPAQQRPNVLVIMTDQQKATASHLYGNTFCETPSLQRLADEGVLYEHAITPHPLCAARRASRSGPRQWPHSHGGRRNETRMPPDTNHAFRVWKEAGYHTGLIGKNHCFLTRRTWPSSTPGARSATAACPRDATTKGMEWFRPVEGIHAAHELRRSMTPQNPRFAYATSDFPLEDYSTGLVAGQTVRFLEQHSQAEQPFALWVSFPDPHEPWVCPQRYADLFPPDKIDLPPRREDEFDEGRCAGTQPRALRHPRLAQRRPGSRSTTSTACSASTTAWCASSTTAWARSSTRWSRTGLRENTIVVYCSDHGDFSGEHGMHARAASSTTA